jgi:Lipid A 3-O-deacylase (PagL)
VGGIVGRTLPVTWLRAHSDRSLAMGSVDVGRVMTNLRGPGPLAGQFEFLVEMTPLVVIHQPARAFGLTASPLHMRWNFAPISRRRFRAFAEASGGVVITNHPVPVRATTRFNFIDQAGFGVRFAAGARRVWLAGYRFQHISNAGRSEPNPGVNFNFVYVGVSFLQ